MRASAVLVVGAAVAVAVALALVTTAATEATAAPATTTTTTRAPTAAPTASTRCPTPTWTGVVASVQAGAAAFTMFNTANRRMCAGRVAHKLDGNRTMLGWVPCSSPAVLRFKLSQENGINPTPAAVGCMYDAAARAALPESLAGVPSLAACGSAAMRNNFALFSFSNNKGCRAGSDLERAFASGFAPPQACDSDTAFTQTIYASERIPTLPPLLAKRHLNVAGSLLQPGFFYLGCYSLTNLPSALSAALGANNPPACRALAIANGYRVFGMAASSTQANGDTVGTCYMLPAATTTVFRTTFAAMWTALRLPLSTRCGVSSGPTSANLIMGDAAFSGAVALYTFDPIDLDAVDSDGAAFYPPLDSLAGFTPGATTRGVNPFSGGAAHGLPDTKWNDSLAAATTMPAGASDDVSRATWFRLTVVGVPQPPPSSSPTTEFVVAETYRSSSFSFGAPAADSWAGSRVVWYSATRTVSVRPAMILFALTTVASLPTYRADMYSPVFNVNFTADTLPDLNALASGLGVNGVRTADVSYSQLVRAVSDPQARFRFVWFLGGSYLGAGAQYVDPAAYVFANGTLSTTAQPTPTPVTVMVGPITTVVLQDAVPENDFVELNALGEGSSVVPLFASSVLPESASITTTTPTTTTRYRYFGDNACSCSTLQGFGDQSFPNGTCPEGLPSTMMIADPPTPGARPAPLPNSTVAAIVAVAMFCVVLVGAIVLFPKIHRFCFEPPRLGPNDEIAIGELGSNARARHGREGHGPGVHLVVPVSSLATPGVMRIPSPMMNMATPGGGIPQAAAASSSSSSAAAVAAAGTVASSRGRSWLPAWMQPRSSGAPPLADAVVVAMTTMSAAGPAAGVGGATAMSPESLADALVSTARVSPAAAQRIVDARVDLDTLCSSYATDARLRELGVQSAQDRGKILTYIATAPPFVSAASVPTAATVDF